MKTSTMRISEELDKKLSEYAKDNDMSKNQVVRKAIRELVSKTNKNEKECDHQ